MQRTATTAWMTLLECAAGFQAGWLFLPRVITGKQINLDWEFFSMSSDVSAHHLRTLWIFLAVYLIARSFTRTAGLLERLLTKPSALVQGTLLVALVFLVYLNTGSQQPISGDTIPAKLLPISILTEGDLDLDEFYDSISQGHRYCVIPQNGHWYSAYPIFPALTALPVYAAAAWLLPEGFETWRLTYSLPEGDILRHVPRVLEHYSAALIAALSAAVVWVVLRSALPGRTGLVMCLTLGYAFGTSVHSTASSALWMHGPSCLFLALSVYFLTRTRHALTYALFAAGLCAGWAIACRPTNAIPAVLLGFWCILTYRWRAWRFVLGGAIIMSVVTGVNYAIYHQLFGGYSGQTSLFRTFDPLALLTILFSPSRGLFLFSPFLLVITLAALLALKTTWRTLWAFCLYSAFALFLLYAAWGPWAGGHSFGPRLLTEAALLLVLAAPMALHRIPARSVVITALLWGLTILSMHTHTMGAFQGDRRWTLRKFQSEDFAAIWNFRDSQLVWTIYESTEE